MKIKPNNYNNKIAYFIIIIQRLRKGYTELSILAMGIKKIFYTLSLQICSNFD